jgi:hypothetical protein
MLEVGSCGCGSDRRQDADDATCKQAKVILDLARLVAARDPERKALYGS